MWLFLDFDGTLVDSLGMARAVYDQFVRQCGVEPDDVEFRQLNGPSLPEIVDLIADRRRLAVGRTELLSRYSGIWATAYRSVQPKPGAESLLLEARSRGINLALVTSAASSFITPYLCQQRWEHLFAITITGDQVRRSKPDPEVYDLALRRSGADRREVQVIEDSVNGVRAAAAAGLKVVGFSDGADHSSTPEQLRASGAMIVIRSLRDFFGSGWS
jgi:beta-phosphoglucomutase